MSGDHNKFCSGNQCQGHAKQQARDEIDLISRLRARPKLNAPPWALLMFEAADKIERLEQIIFAFETKLATKGYEIQITDQQEEMKSLREQLENAMQVVASVERERDELIKTDQEPFGYFYKYDGKWLQGKYGDHYAIPLYEYPQAAFNAGLEAAAKVCDEKHWDDHRMFADAIRTLEKK